jgi:hypothetical protein
VGSFFSYEDSSTTTRWLPQLANKRARPRSASRSPALSRSSSVSSKSDLEYNSSVIKSAVEQLKKKEKKRDLTVLYFSYQL